MIEFEPPWESYLKLGTTGIRVGSKNDIGGAKGEKVGKAVVASRILTLEKFRGSKLGWKEDRETKGFVLNQYLHCRNTVLFSL